MHATCLTLAASGSINCVKHPSITSKTKKIEVDAYKLYQTCTKSLDLVCDTHPLTLAIIKIGYLIASIPNSIGFRFVISLLLYKFFLSCFGQKMISK